MRWTTSLTLSRCCTLSVVQTSMPASSSSTASCQRFGCRAPGAFVCASSSSRSSAGRRASAASRSNSRRLTPRSSAARGASRSRPAARASVSARPWVSSQPITTSVPPARGGACRLEHRVGLADAGGGAEEDLEPSAASGLLVALDAAQERVGVGAHEHTLHPLTSRPHQDPASVPRPARPGPDVQPRQGEEQQRDEDGVVHGQDGDKNPSAGVKATSRTDGEAGLRLQALHQERERLVEALRLRVAAVQAARDRHEAHRDARLRERGLEQHALVVGARAGRRRRGR